MVNSTLTNCWHKAYVGTWAIDSFQLAGYALLAELVRL